MQLKKLHNLWDDPRVERVNIIILSVKVIIGMLDKSIRVIPSGFPCSELKILPKSILSFIVFEIDEVSIG